MDSIKNGPQDKILNEKKLQDQPITRGYDVINTK